MGPEGLICYQTAAPYSPVRPDLRLSSFGFARITGLLCKEHMGYSEKETERQRDRQTDKETDRQTGRQRQADRKRETVR